jgi:hypothetical protein
MHQLKICSVLGNACPILPFLFYISCRLYKVEAALFAEMLIPKLAIPQLPKQNEFPTNAG